MRAALGLVAAGWLVTATLATAEVYRWVDADGRLHFTTELHEVPAAKRGAAWEEAVEKAQPSSPPSKSAAPPASRAPSTARSAAADSEVYVVEVERAGTGMVVPVRLNDRVTAQFLIDTGASDVLLPSAVAEELGIRIGPETRRVRYATANGVVENPVVTLDSVDLGGARVEGVPASVSPSLPIGLLGLSFFHHFTYQIDAARGRVELRPNGLVEKGLIRGGRSEAQWRAEFASLDARRRAVEEALGSIASSRGRERIRLQSLLADLERDRGLLEEEADRGRVPVAWRQE